MLNEVRELDTKPEEWEADVNDDNKEEEEDNDDGDEGDEMEVENPMKINGHRNLEKEREKKKCHSQ